jgi:hypothetical protein
VAVSGNIMIWKKGTKKCVVTWYPAFYNGSLCRGVSFQVGHMSLPMPAVKNGLSLVSQNPLTVALKRVILFCYCVSSIPTRDQNGVTTKTCNKYFCIYCAPLSWAWTRLSLWSAYIMHYVCALLTVTFVPCTWNQVYLHKTQLGGSQAYPLSCRLRWYQW